MRVSDSYFFAGSRKPRDDRDISVHSAGGQRNTGEGGDVPSAQCKWFFLDLGVCCSERERERECECECGMRMRMLERCACVRGGGERRLIGGGFRDFAADVDGRAARRKGGGSCLCM